MTSSQCSDGVRATTVPVPSTWPWTMCPPSRVAAVTARSRLTREPTSSPPSEVLASVSCITSAVKVSWSRSATVRQQPLTEIESPRGVDHDVRPAHGEAYGVALVDDCLDDAELLDDSGEHSVLLLGRVVRVVRGEGEPDVGLRPSPRTVMSATARCIASARVVIPRSPTALSPAPRSIGAT